MKNVLDKHVKAYEGNIEYDFDNTLMLNWYSQRITELTNKSSSLLELGLGHGYTTMTFSKYFAKHIVLEGSSAVIDNFKNKYPNCPVNIIHTYFDNFISNEKFDVIVMGFILEHVDDPAKILSHFKRFLAPNGQLFVSVPNAEVLNRRLGHLAGLLPDIHELSENDFLLGHKRYYTAKTITQEVQQAGYIIERIEGIYLKPFT
ncbi:MAG: class I SAM-dependent methyltransferase, partial [Candidatus Rickettsiella isopodorum]|nr:class I SAM-dependent methyltransferase [Candidatus Rickettsiella isopodorum]